MLGEKVLKATRHGSSTRQAEEGNAKFGMYHEQLLQSFHRFKLERWELHEPRLATPRQSFRKPSGIAIYLPKLDSITHRSACFSTLTIQRLRYNA